MSLLRSRSIQLCLFNLVLIYVVISYAMSLVEIKNELTRKISDTSFCRKASISLKRPASKKYYLKTKQYSQAEIMDILQDVFETKHNSHRVANLVIEKTLKVDRTLYTKHQFTFTLMGSSLKNYAHGLERLTDKYPTLMPVSFTHSYSNVNDLQLLDANITIVYFTTEDKKTRRVK